MPPKKAADPAPAPAAAEPEKIDPGPEIDLRKDKIAAAFRIFDPENTGAAKTENIPTIMRYLRLYVTDKDFAERVLPDLREPGGDGSAPPLIQYPRFEKKALDLMDAREFEPDTEDLLLSAFRALDPSNNGWLKLEKAKGFFCETGESPLSEAEWAAMVGAMRRGKMQDEDGNEFEVVYYEDYVSLAAR